MVDQQINDGKRIAQLLASELTGRSRGALAAVSITDSDAEAIPTDSGTVAYRVSNGEQQFATVQIYPEYAVVAFAVEPAFGQIDHEFDVAKTDTATEITVTSGAAVKRVFDLLRATVETDESS